IWLSDIYITRKECQNLGIGNILLKNIIIYCKKNRIKTLSGKMVGDIDKLKKFYTSHGFHISEDNIDITFNGKYCYINYDLTVATKEYINEIKCSHNALYVKDEP
ncbi:TPA: GNAT family N-acetyltransferase, partial [Proteus mirabilis]|nr:GNAT family N-acetyltransferase [Proteus mirabilis]